MHQSSNCGHFYYQHELEFCEIRLERIQFGDKMLIILHDQNPRLALEVCCSGIPVYAVGLVFHLAV